MNTPKLITRTGFRQLLAATALLAAVAHLGCSGHYAPTAPSNASAVSFVPAPTPDLQTSGSGSGGGNPRTDKYIVATQGGVITAGRHTVIIPAGALYSNTTIRVEDESAEGFIKCELRPHGITFRTPVILVTRFSDVTDPSGYTMFWDAVSPISGAQAWVNVGGQVTVDHSGIQVQLNHFSQYAPAKAGW